MFMFTDSGVRMYFCLTRYCSDPSPPKEMILPSFPSTGVTLSCFQPFTLHLTDSSLHRLVLRLVLRPDNIDSWAELLNPQNLSYFFLLLPFYIHLPLRLPPGSSLSSSISLFLLSVQSFSFALPLSPALSEVLVLGEFLRGISPALDYQYGP